MVLKILRTIIGLPFVTIIFLFSVVTCGILWPFSALYDWCVYGHIWVKWSEFFDISTPYQFIKNVWEKNNAKN